MNSLIARAKELLENKTVSMLLLVMKPGLQALPVRLLLQILQRLIN